jgi:hypothetical protein
MKPFAELTGQQKALELVRWLCVPAAAVLAVIVLSLLARLAIPPVYAQPPGAPPAPTNFGARRLVFRAFSVLMGASFVAAGAMTAPRRRLPTALVLATLWIGYSFLSHIAVHLGRGTPHYLDFALAAAAAAAAAGALFIWHFERSARQPVPRGRGG